MVENFRRMYSIETLRDSILLSYHLETRFSFYVLDTLRIKLQIIKEWFSLIFVGLTLKKN